jgi:hypothetical protein
MLKCFREIIGETVEAYVDDIIVKSKKVELASGRPGENFRETMSKRHQTLEGLAAWVHRLRAWHRSQPEEDLGHREARSNSEYKEGVADYEVARSAQPLHFTPRQMRLLPLSASKESQSVRVDI